MEEFFGLILLAVAIVLVTVGVPWFREHGESAVVDRFMLAELYAIAVIGLLACGGALVIADLSRAWSAGETMHLVIGIGAVVVLAVAARFARTWFKARKTA